jgi:phosphate transport system substrate-binding protein
VNRMSIRQALVPGIAALALALTACSAGNAEEGDGHSTSGDANLSGTLNGGGSSAQESAQGVWRAGFQDDNSGVTVNYDPVGSGTGRENFISAAYAYAGSDSALSTDEGELDAAKERCNGEDPVEVPAYVSPIAVVYNLEGVDKLQLSPEALAGIFAGKITKWNDPAIAADNDGVDLPSTAITPVHRSDDSGTQDNFTQYLSAVAPDTWTDEADGIWPLKSGEGANGTSGVIESVKNGAGSIGFADESQAGDLGVASVKVGSEYVVPSADSAAKTVDVSPRVEGRPAGDIAIDVDR